MSRVPIKDITVGVQTGLIDLDYIAAGLGMPKAAVDLAAVLSNPAMFTLPTGPNFDAAAYLDRYPDVAGAGLHPVIHYIRHGKGEGRHAFPVFQSVLDGPAPAQKPIWVESHDFSFTGAPTALLHILQGIDGAQIQLGAPVAGPLADDFAKITGPIILHGQAAGRAATLDQMAAMQARCGALLRKAGAGHVIANSFLSWPMVLAARQLGLRCTWIIHEPDGDEMAAQTPAPIFDQLRGEMAGVQRLIFVSNSSRAAWGADLNPNAEVIAKALPPAPPKARDLGRKAADCAEGDILLLSVGTASPRKGQADLVGALEHLADLGAADRLVTVLVGYVESPYAIDLRARLAALRQRGVRVKFLRQSTQPEERTKVEYLYAAADIFIMSSRAESLPLTTAEALAAGCPVISTDSPGIGEMVAHGQTGLLYSAGDSTALARHIAVLAENTDMRRAMRQKIAANQDHSAYRKMIAQYRAVFAI